MPQISAAGAMEALTTEVHIQLEDTNGAVTWDVKTRCPLTTTATAMRIMRWASAKFHIFRGISLARPVPFVLVHAANLTTGQRYNLQLDDQLAVPSLLVGRATVPLPAIPVPAGPVPAVNRATPQLRRPLHQPASGVTKHIVKR